MKETIHLVDQINLTQEIPMVLLQCFFLTVLHLCGVRMVAIRTDRGWVLNPRCALVVFLSPWNCIISLLVTFLGIGCTTIHVEFGDSYAGQIIDWRSCSNCGNAWDQHTCFLFCPDKG